VPTLPQTRIEHQLLPSGTVTDGMAMQLSIATHPNTVENCKSEKIIKHAGAPIFTVEFYYAFILVELLLQMETLTLSSLPPSSLLGCHGHKMHCQY
jgi:hypothetical protein